jgi:UDP-N-acetylmuramate--alanine ligase
MKLIKTPTLHFVGIGGIGMSAIAEVLLQLGYEISGSDVSDSDVVDKLKNLGAKIYIGHKEENFPNDGILVYSSAIPKDNPEYCKALRLNRPIMRRAEILADLMRLKKSIAIAGSHGKTTTSGMVATIFAEANLNPTYIIGGVISALGNHARAGTGDWLIAEADESDGTFLNYTPIYSIINNIDNDHLDHYINFDGVKNAFLEFSNKVPFYGGVIINIDDAECDKLIKLIKRPVITFGTNSNANFQIKNKNLETSTFDLHSNNKKLATIELSIKGEHNMSNAAAAFSVCFAAGIETDLIKKGLKRFTGAKRRFETIKHKYKALVIEDYAHHPTEIVATLRTAQQIKGNRKVIAFFEPHRFTRTKECWGEFLHCFNLADNLYLMPIYAASEQPIVGITSERLAEDLNKLHPSFCNIVNTHDDLSRYLKMHLQEDSIILILGAGSIGRKAKEIIAKS